MIHEFHGQPIEKLWMRRRLPLGAEVFGSSDQADAEVRLPHAIHKCPSGRRRTAVNEPMGECEPIRRAVASERMQELRHARRDLLSRSEEIAAVEPMRLPRHLALANH